MIEKDDRPKAEEVSINELQNLLQNTWLVQTANVRLQETSLYRKTYHIPSSSLVYIPQSLREYMVMVARSFSGIRLIHT